MKKIIFYLKTCSTCARIMNELGVDDNWQLREIKSNAITEEELDQMKKHTGSYEALFSKRSKQYQALNLKNKPLKEEDYKAYILQEYTFLKRPVIWIGQELFIGNSKTVIEQAKLFSGTL